MLLVKWLAYLLHSQKLAGSHLTPPTLYDLLLLLYQIYLFQWCLVVSVYIYCDCDDTVFQIERGECNIPIIIGRLLATWLEAQAFSQMVSMSASSTIQLKSNHS